MAETVKNKPPMPSTAKPDVNGVPAVEKKSANGGESKSQRFKRLANMRVPKVVRGIRNIGNLAARGQYEYTPEQVGKLIALLRSEVDSVAKRFEGNAAAAEVNSIF